MPSVNKVILVGHLGSDPELKQTASGQSLCKFRMATSRRWRDKDGQQQEDTCWHSIISWGKSAELCATYLRKGRQVYIEGRISTRSYEDAQGTKRYWTDVVSTSVVFLGPRDVNQAHSSEAQCYAVGASNAGPTNGNYHHASEASARNGPGSSASPGSPPDLEPPGPYSRATPMPEDDLPF